MTFTVPAEWAPHRAMWIGFPSHAELWEDDLEPARREVADLVRALAGPGREQVRMLVRGDEAMRAASEHLAGVENVEIRSGEFGDIWFRDTGPIFLSGGDGVVPLQHVLAAPAVDPEPGAAGARLERHDFVLEGGAIDHDGAGSVLTTRQCLLNPNRNRGWDQASAEAALAKALGARKVLWLGDGLEADHTDGHVDNLARFIGPGAVVCPMAYGEDDPNAEVYAATARALAGMTDADGTPLKVIRIPSPGRILDEDGETIAASHMNFLIANGAVVAPVYDAAAAGPALHMLKTLFPGREVIGLPSRAILTGGGSFHCITQQEPA